MNNEIPRVAREITESVQLRHSPVLDNAPRDSVRSIIFLRACAEKKPAGHGLNGPSRDRTLRSALGAAG